jgi:DinB superfamily
MSNPQVSLLLTLIDQAFDHQSWHGTNLRGSIRGLNVADAAWRPAPDRHSIWEIVVHAAYWKYTVRRRLLAEAKGSFPLKGSNWFPRPTKGKAAAEEWKSDVKLLVEVHRSMRESVSRLTDTDLPNRPQGSKVSNLTLITGIASHDLYHAGQIQLLKRLLPKT